MSDFLSLAQQVDNTLHIPLSNRFSGVSDKYIIEGVSETKGLHCFFVPLFPDHFDVSEALKLRIQRFQKLIDESEHDYELVAVNKMYDSVVVRRQGSGLEFQTAIERNGAISCKYRAGGRDGLGTNLLILDERFAKYESLTMENGSTLIGCNVRELDEYLSNGWKVNRRGGVMN